MMESSLFYKIIQEEYHQYSGRNKYHKYSKFFLKIVKNVTKTMCYLVKFKILLKNSANLKKE